MTEVFLRNDVAEFFRDDPVGHAFALTGEVVRSVAGRETLRLELAGRPFYLKRHRGVGFGELFKNWLVFKRPVIGARNEFEACRRLASRGIRAPTVAAFGETAALAPARESFVLCDALLGYQDLEQLTLSWPDHPPDVFLQRRLVMRVAEFARRFHAAGLIHRDFYLCHLLLHEDPDQPMAVLDLHRAKIFERIPRRWIVRDLAALLYSSLDLPLSRRAWLRFVRVYSGMPLRQAFTEDGPFWHQVYERASALYAKGTRKGLTLGRFQP